MVLVATAITLAVGLLLGVASARSNRFSAGLRPLLDAAQTMPAFVYLIPAVALFGPTRFTGIVAALIFAVPPVIRLVEAGIRTVPTTVVEAATSSGSTTGQLLFKVQLPMARPALMLAANQGIVLVLAMVVVGGLVGAGGLGYDVVAGFARRDFFGEGLAAGVAIVLLGIMLDRISQGAGRRPRLDAPTRQRGCRGERGRDRGPSGVGFTQGIRRFIDGDVGRRTVSGGTGGGVQIRMKTPIRSLAAVVAVTGLVLAACTSGGGGSPAASGAGGGGTVNMAINPWVGYEANAAVVGYLLENELGYTVVNKDLKEDVSWQGFETGEVDVIIEDWGHPELEKKYVDEDKVAQVAGETGNTGIIGWYVPGWMAEEYPDITDYKNLNKYADLFKTSESGDLGQFLGSDPSYVQYDEALVTNLDLELQGHLLGRRGGDDHRSPAGRRRQEAASRLLVGSAVAEFADRAGPSQPPAVRGRLRRGPREGRLRLPGDAAEEDRQHEVRDRRRQGVRPRQELQLDERGPEPRLRLHHEPGHDRRGSGQEVGRGERGEVEALARPVASVSG